MKKFLIALFSAITSVFLLSTCAFAVEFPSGEYVGSSTPTTFIYVYADAVDKKITSEDIDDLASRMVKVSEDTGFNIGIIITDNVGPFKSDRAVIDFADTSYEEAFGVDTTGILLLINDDTKYDWISTSGDCIDYFTDSRINSIFDAIGPHLDEGDYHYAAKRFLRRVESCYQQGIDYDYGYSYHDEADSSDRVTKIMGIAIFLLFFIIIARKSYKKVYNSYTKLKPYPKTSYSSINDVNYTESSSELKRTYYVTVNSSSSSSSSRSGSRSRSSTHRSSGGGRHGGGGRRR